MKIYRIFTLAVITVLCASFFSCSDDDDDDFSSKYLPETIEASYRKMSDGSYGVRTSTYFYDENNRLIGWEDDDYKNTVTYNNGRVESLKRQYKENENSFFEYHFTYEGNKIIVGWGADHYPVREIYTNDAGYITSYDYFDEDVIRLSYSGKNIASIEYEIIIDYISGEVISKSKNSIKYDNKAGVFRNVNTPQWFLYMFAGNMDINVGSNNPVSSEFITYENGELFGKTNITYKNTYNNDGYPVSISYTIKNEISNDGKYEISEKIKSLRNTLIDDEEDGSLSYTITYYEKK